MSTLKGITEALKASKSLQQVKKGASAVKAFGKTAYGEAKGAFDVGKEYLKTQKTRFAGTDLGKQLGVIKTGTADRYQKLPDWMKQELRSAAIFAGAEHERGEPDGSGPLVLQQLSACCRYGFY